MFSKCSTCGYYMLRTSCMLKPRIRGSFRDLKFPRKSGKNMNSRVGVPGTVRQVAPPGEGHVNGHSRAEIPNTFPVTISVQPRPCSAHPHADAQPRTSRTTETTCSLFPTFSHFLSHLFILSHTFSDFLEPSRTSFAPSPAFSNLLQLPPTFSNLLRTEPWGAPGNPEKKYETVDRVEFE